MTDYRAKLGAHRRSLPCEHCGTEGRQKHDRTCPKAKRSRSAGRRGKRREKHVEHKYGPTKVGQFNGPIDNIGSTFKWQSKTTTAMPPDWAADLAYSDIRAMTPKLWFTDPMKHMAGNRDDLHPLVIKSWTWPGHSLDVIVVRTEDWCVWHDGAPLNPVLEYLAMTGDYFLDVHGRDEDASA